MDFWKMNGAGNDFLIVDNRQEQLPVEKLSAMARKLCERHLSIGADGFMVVESSGCADLKMVFLNSDGSLGEMCGNGARCICRYAYENGLSGDTPRIETTAGVVTGLRIDSRNYRIRLNDPSQLDHRPVDCDGKTYDTWYVELGNPGVPHAVLEIPDLRSRKEEELFALGKKLRYHPAFPKGANVNFYEVTEKNHLWIRTWERGVEGFTYACGTGTGSVAAVLTVSGRMSGEIRADMAGGTLSAEAETEKGTVRNLYLTGPTNIVAKGIICDEELRI